MVCISLQPFNVIFQSDQISIQITISPLSQTLNYEIQFFQPQINRKYYMKPRVNVEAETDLKLTRVKNMFLF